jgi:threonine dehydratase
MTAVDDVLSAWTRLRKVLRPTPLLWSERRGAHLKLENLQVTGSFKVRGAYNALAIQVERGDHRPVVAASAGNHAKGVAWAARRLGLEAVVVMPRNAPRTKIVGCAAMGARVEVFGDSFEEAYRRAREIEGAGYRFLHAFDDPDVVAGQGTVAMELLELEPDVVLVPIGGGSLAAGTGMVLHRRVVGVQVEGLDAMARTIRGDLRDLEPAGTVADGLRVRRPGELTREICGRVLRDIVTVKEAEVRAAVADVAAHERVIAEGAGAAAVAALSKVSGARKVAVVSGGNIDGRLLSELMSDTLAPHAEEPGSRLAGADARGA